MGRAHRGHALRVVVVGASLAGVRAAQALRARGYDGELTIVGDESDVPYDRPPLSKALLAGTASPDQVRLLTDEDTVPDARWRLGTRAIGIDLPSRQVALGDGTRLGFDGLVIATGARARQLPGTAHLPGVHTLRTLADARQLYTALRDGDPTVTVIGAGFIGSEVTATARGIGLPVTLVDAAPLPLLGAVGPRVARFCAALHQRHGVHLRLGTGVESVLADRRWIQTVLRDGTRLTSDIVVIGLGTVPNVEWLEGSGVLVHGGIRTDAALRVLASNGDPLPAVVAAGDVVRWRHPLFDHDLVRVEHWSNAVGQGRAAAVTLLHQLLRTRDDQPSPLAAFAEVPSFWTHQYDMKMTSLGLPGLGTATALLDGSETESRFIVGYGRAGRLVGAVAVNYPRPLARYRHHIGTAGSWPPPAAVPATVSTGSSQHC